MNNNTPWNYIIIVILKILKSKLENHSTSWWGNVAMAPGAIVENFTDYFATIAEK